MRGIEDLGVLAATCERFCAILEQHCKYIVVSGFVAIATGRTRATEDIDIIMQNIPLEKFIELHHDLEKAGFECIQDKDAEKLYKLYLAEKLPIRYILKDQLLPEMELKMAKDFLDQAQIENRVKIPETSLDVWFSSIETNIAFKEELLKSDKDMEDARHLRNIFADKINEESIKKVKKLIVQYRLK